MMPPDSRTTSSHGMARRQKSAIWICTRARRVQYTTSRAFLFRAAFACNAPQRYERQHEQRRFRPNVTRVRFAAKLRALVASCVRVDERAVRKP